VGRDLRIGTAAFETIIEHARESLPNECCGLLIGAGTQIERAHRSHNLESSATRFLIDPRDHVDAIRAARASGLVVLGVYHSHPSSAATPSPSDLAEASYSEYLYLIVSLRVSPADVRLFRLENGGFREETLYMPERDQRIDATHP
jgi:proteasome lid subunit RPN8/RPN11